ncbi:ethanolamine ammonia-lyase subunit EutC [Aeoliella sp. SH292]|uniref:ethanolamine ammonia-lyase subunit EutC n=1 Tax=Aeoliella sp. SH292 TaxID=3454464 RepID=UPI003F98D548
MNPQPLTTPDASAALRGCTNARIALGRAGASLPTRAWLDFKAAHAAAKDAVHVTLEVECMCEAITSLGYEVLACDSSAPDRHAYLRAPELGRQLDRASRTRLAEASANTNQIDLAIIVTDGLSASAAHTNAVSVLSALLPLLHADSWKIGPICVARLGRVALQDEIGSVLNAQMALILIGERPGLAVSDSLGAYMVYDPKPGNTDANRSCISNIHGHGLAPEQAAEDIHLSLTELRRRRFSGVSSQVTSNQQTHVSTERPH